jgi:D-glycero-D-manno-heptose 1,7-bisphosphate phosphatase
MGIGALNNVRAVFLDRDGVLVRATERDGIPQPPACLAEMELLPGVLEACKALKRAGFALMVATNQPDVARGRQLRSVVEKMHSALKKWLPLDDIRVCYHDDCDGCRCRKPAPGMLTQSASEFGLELARSYMVGDRWRDIEAGRRAGCTTVLIDYKYAESTCTNVSADFHTMSLIEAAGWILAQR